MAQCENRDDAATNKGEGVDEVDCYSRGEGYINLVQKLDHTGYETSYYRTEVNPVKLTTSVGRRLKLLNETFVSNMNHAERALREKFEYNYHKSTEEGWFEADSPQEVLGKYKEVLEPWVEK